MTFVIHCISVQNIVQKENNLCQFVVNYIYKEKTILYTLVKNPGKPFDLYTVNIGIFTELNFANCIHKTFTEFGF